MFNLFRADDCIKPQRNILYRPQLDKQRVVVAKIASNRSPLARQSPVYCVDWYYYKHADAGGRSEIRYPASATASSARAALAATTTDHLIWSDAASALPCRRQAPPNASQRSSSSPQPPPSSTYKPREGALRGSFCSSSSSHGRPGPPGCATPPGSCIIRGQEGGSRAAAGLIDVVGPTDGRTAASLAAAERTSDGAARKQQPPTLNQRGCEVEWSREAVETRSSHPAGIRQGLHREIRDGRIVVTGYCIHQLSLCTGSSDGPGGEPTMGHQIMCPSYRILNDPAFEWLTWWHPYQPAPLLQQA